MKSRCKLLIENLAPAMLKSEIKRLVALQNRDAKTDDLALHNLILDRAKAQQRYHTMQQELKVERKQLTKSDTKVSARSDSKKSDAKSTAPKTGGAPPAGSATAGAAAGTTTRPPPRDGCFFCKGPHTVQFCPTATEEQKQECYKKMKESKVTKSKAARAGEIPGHHRVID